MYMFIVPREEWYFLFVVHNEGVIDLDMLSFHVRSSLRDSYRGGYVAYIVGRRDGFETQVYCNSHTVPLYTFQYNTSATQIRLPAVRETQTWKYVHKRICMNQVKHPLTNNRFERSILDLLRYFNLSTDEPPNLRSYFVNRRLTELLVGDAST